MNGLAAITASVVFIIYLALIFNGLWFPRLCEFTVDSRGEDSSTSYFVGGDNE